MSRLDRAILVGLVIVVASGCSDQPRRTPPKSALDREVANLKYFFNEICLPVVADHVPFETIVASHHLTKKRVRSFNIVGSNPTSTIYCPPDRSKGCFTPPSPADCLTSVGGVGDFVALNRAIEEILKSDKRKWISVKDPSSSEVGYGKAFCDADKTISIRTSGFRPHDILGYPSCPLEGPCRRTPIYAGSTEFDVYVQHPRFANWCSPPDASADALSQEALVEISR